MLFRPVTSHRSSQNDITIHGLHGLPKARSSHILNITRLSQLAPSIVFACMTTDSPPRPPTEKRRRLERVTAACNLCKKRKVKCDGEQPCDYCVRKDCADTCTFSASKRVGEAASIRSATSTPNHAVEQRENGSRQRDYTPRTPRIASDRSAVDRDSNSHHPTQPREPGSSLSPTISRDDHHEDTVVPREGRILRDAQGKFIFIGDCAPLSFLQTVRHLIASEVEPEGLSTQISRDSIIEGSRSEFDHQHHDISVANIDVTSIVEEYLVATSGLVDIFRKDDLFNEMEAWVSGQTSHSNDAAAAAFFLVLAIGLQEKNPRKSEAWSNHARNLLLKHMCNSMNVATVQGFVLLTIYMLRAFQPNGAYLYFSLAARTAYAIGIHRTEVNASFGPPIKVMRDSIWKSLRVIDMLISSILGRPPCTSDSDCTVKYNVNGQPDSAAINILDASVQLFTITEQVVVQIYSRKRISLRISDHVSRQLKGWASKWLGPLSTSITHPERVSRDIIIGSCSTLCSYYYGIMLLTRPFLIYELYEFMGASMKGGGSQVDHAKKRQYADAALDAAASFVETLQNVVIIHRMPQRMPLVVSWLFTASLALAVGILGRSNLAFESNCEASIRCLEHFGEVDPHARQYSLITRSILQTTTRHVKKREQKLRAQYKQASSNLFGMLPLEPSHGSDEQRKEHRPPVVSVEPEQPGSTATTTPFDWTIYDSDFSTLAWPSNEYDQGLQDFLQPGTYNFDGGSVADIPLFPMYDQQMGIGHG
ncbi:unnamed protein product [Periconia digitata]|uniref:Zn(2)-C6 fungal-type domain-containing protein n=1 Tax=Periconia digitata TaxID=1303443 RepID=A0A9W4XI08_9PLEO|nr:unnamed protein product [Periconia digitata]